MSSLSKQGICVTNSIIPKRLPNGDDNPKTLNNSLKNKGWFKKVASRVPNVDTRAGLRAPLPVIITASTTQEERFLEFS